MKYFLNHKSILSGLIIVLIFTGCKKFVEIDPPNSVLVTASVFKNDGAATAALTAIYASMANNSESVQMAQHSGRLADELFTLSSDEQVRPYFVNAMLAKDPSGNVGGITYGPWNSAYSYIYQANAIIEGLRNTKGTSVAVNRQLTAEAEFIRAFWYFYLTNCYGDVPLVTSTDYKHNSQLPRAAKDKVYDQVIADLTDAKNLLNTNYVDATDTATTTERARPNKAAASALLARVYLYKGLYENAETEATQVITDSRFGLEDDPNNVFLANSREAIWQLANPDPSPIGGQTYDGYYFILIAAPSDGNGNTDQISAQLMNAFESGDHRKSSWIGSISFDTTTYYFPYKYQVYDNTQNPNNRTEYSMMLRLAEQHLIRAEARAQQGNTSGCLEDLNKIRHRAGLPDYAGLTDQESLLAAILHERQVEMFAEWGHRWFDLIRMNKINSVMGAPGNVCQQKGGTWAPYKSLYPIPQADIGKDSHLTQNPGY